MWRLFIYLRGLLVPGMCVDQTPLIGPHRLRWFIVLQEIFGLHFMLGYGRSRVHFPFTYSCCISALHKRVMRR